jgi:hypothetical protein
MNGKSSRGDERNSTLLVAELRIGEAAARKVLLRNVSATGLMAEMDAAPAQGEIVRITVGQLDRVPGVVMWRVEKRFGVRFETPIDPAAVKRPMTSSPRPYEPPPLDLRKPVL